MQAIIIRPATAILFAGALVLPSPARPRAFLGDLGEELPIQFMVDSGTDQVYRLIDANDNGTYNDLGEVHVFYDPAVGSLPLVEPVVIVASANDFLYVGDRGLGAVIAMEDLDDDGDCNDADPNPQGSEHFVYLDGTNASAVPIGEVNGVTTKLLGLVWVAVSDASGGIDAILRCQDLNSDLDANDVGEIQVHFQPTGGDPRPVAVETGPDGNVYYVESGSGLARGLYRVHDDDRNALYEAEAFYLPAGAIDLTSVEYNEELDTWWLVEAGAGTVHRLRDLDADGQIGAGEANVYFQGSAGRVRDLTVTDDGETYWPFDAEPELGVHDKIFVWRDENGDGEIAPVEEFEVFDETVSGTIDMGRPTSIDRDFHGHEEVGEHFCAARTGCPCGNDTPEDLEAGCRNSTGAGAVIEGEGTASVSLDDLAFHGTGLPPNQPALLFVGEAALNNGNGIVFGDGLRCAGVNVKRLGIETASAGGDAEWGPGLGALGNFGIGDTRYFQIWYRDPSGGPTPNGCGSGFNTSAGIELTFER